MAQSMQVFKDDMIEAIRLRGGQDEFLLLQSSAVAKYDARNTGRFTLPSATA